MKKDHSKIFKNEPKNILSVKIVWLVGTDETSKGIVKLANLRNMFGYLFEEIEFTLNAKSSMQLSLCTTVMQKFHTSYFYSSFFCYLCYVVTE